MSPYRVLVTNNNGGKLVLASQVFTDNSTYQRKILVFRKERQFDEESLNDIAYRMITKTSSTVLHEYLVSLNDDLKLYSLFDMPAFINVSNNERTLASCLVSAMEHYCKQNNLNILKMF